MQAASTIPERAESGLKLKPERGTVQAARQLL